MEEQQHEEVSEQAQKSTPSTLVTIVMSLVLVSALAFVAKSTGLTKKKEKAIAEPTPIVISSPSPLSSLSPSPSLLPSPTAAVTTVNPSPTAKQENIIAVSLETGSYYYKPDVIRAKKGQTVRIELKSVSMMHNFVIDELGVAMPITKSGDTSTVEFVASKTGTFEFYCSVANHRKMGQVGTLVVTE
ncbi:MAG TPA: cupredoxin domain-containing protein [Patescibacteria group bacterium]|nr:cupredoxin domain-containing protein [Patescibacteria group bacterium]